MVINGETQLTGLIGWPVAHTFSPAMHNAAALQLGLNMAYLAMPVHPNDLAEAVRGLPALGFKGFNVTVPHKQAILPLLDYVEQGAAIIGAVNTVVINPHPGGPPQRWHLTGHNTDWLGFLADLAALDVPVKGRDCLVLGAGGSARAIIYALAKAGAKVHLIARRIEQAQALATDFAAVASLHLADLDTLPSRAAGLTAPLIVNATPLGMSPNDRSSIWPDPLPFPDGAFIYDLVYNPRHTKLMHQAESASCANTNGLGMLLHQGLLAFQLWTGEKPHIETMKKVLNQAANL
jgi:shikimate dehydrogenase